MLGLLQHTAEIWQQNTEQYMTMYNKIVTCMDHRNENDEVSNERIGFGQENRGRCLHWHFVINFFILFIWELSLCPIHPSGFNRSCMYLPNSNF